MENVRHSEIVAEAERQLNVKILSADYEILIALYEDGPSSTGKLRSHCSWSKTTFSLLWRHFQRGGW